jgi:hypothetical protein
MKKLDIEKEIELINKLLEDMFSMPPERDIYFNLVYLNRSERFAYIEDKLAFYRQKRKRKKSIFQIQPASVSDSNYRIAEIDVMLENESIMGLIKRKKEDLLEERANLVEVLNSCKTKKILPSDYKSNEEVFLELLKTQNKHLEMPTREIMEIGKIFEVEGNIAKFIDFILLSKNNDLPNNPTNLAEMKKKIQEYKNLFLGKVVNTAVCFDNKEEIIDYVCGILLRKKMLENIKESLRIRKIRNIKNPINLEKRIACLSKSIEINEKDLKLFDTRVKLEEFILECSDLIKECGMSARCISEHYKSKGFKISNVTISSYIKRYLPQLIDEEEYNAVNEKELGLPLKQK